MPAYNYYNDPYVYATPQAPIGQYQQVYKPQQQQTPINNYGIIWASEQDAINYPTAPSTSVIMWDPNVDVFYKKVTDAQGRMILFESYDYAKRERQNENADSAGVANQTNEKLSEEVRALSDKVDSLTNLLSNQSPSKETQQLKLDRINRKQKDVSINAQSDV